MSSESYQTIKDNTLAKIEEISANPKPSYSIDGQSFNHDAYFERLKKTVGWCDEQISKEAPVEIISRGINL